MSQIVDENENKIILTKHSTIKACFYFTLFFVTLLITITLNAFGQFGLINYSFDAKVNSSTDVKEEETSKPGCLFPNLDPWDPSIAKFIEHPSPIQCDQIQPYLTFINHNGELQVNRSEYEFLTEKKNYSKFICKFRTFDRAEGYNDNDIIYSTERILKVSKNYTLSYDMIEVSCSAKKDDNSESEEFYFNIHASPAKRPPRTFANVKDSQLSVFITAIDSISLSVLRRNLPITYDYITNVMKMHVFKHFNKIADNTRPNMIAALTGKRYQDEQADMKADIADEKSLSYFDSLPLIWKFFSANGYATVFNEDIPEWGLFHYLKDGFSKKPADYYYHIFWEALRRNKAKGGKNKNCFLNFPKAKLFLDINKRQLIGLNTELQFIYSFFTQYSHDYGNQIEIADLLYAEFFREMYENNYFNNTVIIFMSDHGHRFSDIRSTLIGLLEERNPFLGIYFPEWFYSLYPDVEKNLKLNSDSRLVTMFDIHATLRDILDNNYLGLLRTKNSKDKGLSLLYEVPKNRTCHEANIPEHYCLCSDVKSLNLSSPFLQDAGERLVRHLNKILGNFSEKCRKIIFEKIIRAELISANDKVSRGFISDGKGGVEKPVFDKQSLDVRISDKISIRVAIETQPNGALFEGTLFGNENDASSWTVDGDVQRLSAYSNSSYCIHDAVLRKFCTCL